MPKTQDETLNCLNLKWFNVFIHKNQCIYHPIQSKQLYGWEKKREFQNPNNHFGIYP